ncbi:MAG: hypothetical protein ACI4GD_04525 [Lachnospiraceae bacterium]
MRFQNMPVILSLLAGFLVCIVTFYYQYDGVSWLWIELGTLVLFYILGQCLRKLFCVILEDKEEETPEEGEDTVNQKDDSEEK